MEESSCRCLLFQLNSISIRFTLLTHFVEGLVVMSSNCGTDSDGRIQTFRIQIFRIERVGRNDRKTRRKLSIIWTDRIRWKSSAVNSNIFGLELRSFCESCFLIRPFCESFILIRPFCESCFLIWSFCEPCFLIRPLLNRHRFDQISIGFSNFRFNCVNNSRLLFRF